MGAVGIILGAAYATVGILCAYFGMKYDTECRPGMKSPIFLFTEFFLVTVLWPFALALALVAVICFRLVHVIRHRKTTGE
jgi:hypothetical protein